MSGLFASAKPHRIKAAHRRRGKVALGRFVQRYYDPGVGRFLSVDPVTANGNTGGNFNRYWYASNNPYSKIDPDGRRDIYIGGAGDSVYKNVKDPALQQKQDHPDRDIQYFSFDDSRRIQTAVDAPLAKGEPLNVTGHSLGGAAAIAAANHSKNPIANLTTIDPVASAGNGAKPSAVSKWTNVIAQPSNPNLSDTVASVGRKVAGTTNTTGADVSIVSHTNHANFSGMMQEANAPKTIDDSYKKSLSK